MWLKRGSVRQPVSLCQRASVLAAVLCASGELYLCDQRLTPAPTHTHTHTHTRTNADKTNSMIQKTHMSPTLSPSFLYLNLYIFCYTAKFSSIHYANILSLGLSDASRPPSSSPSTIIVLGLRFLFITRMSNGSCCLGSDSLALRANSWSLTAS